MKKINMLTDVKLVIRKNANSVTSFSRVNSLQGKGFV
jgi:hypothetical protein